MATRRKIKPAAASKDAAKEPGAPTDDQQAVKDYHAGDFQTTDPITGEARGKLHRDAQQPAEDED